MKEVFKAIQEEQPPFPQALNPPTPVPLGATANPLQAVLGQR